MWLTNLISGNNFILEKRTFILRKDLYFMVTVVLMVKRYAIYFTLPQSDAVYQNATNWLGYDAYSGQKIDIHKSISVESLISNRNCVSRAARYGFHATLKPPFRLNQNKTEQQLVEGIGKFADSTCAFSCMPLKIKTISYFLALAPKKNCEQLSLLAAQYLKNFEPFRAELTPEEFQKRNPHLLNQQQPGYLKQWGYPYAEPGFRS